MQFSQIKLLYIFFALAFLIFSNNSFAGLDEVDAGERQGKLCPTKTKVINYALGTADEESKEHVWHVSLNYLKFAKEWKSDKSFPQDLAKAIGSSFTWLCMAPHSPALHEFEPLINDLVTSKLLNIGSLWIEGLSVTQVRYVDLGVMQIIDPGPLQFKKRMLSAFKGTTLLIGGNHSEVFPKEQFFTMDVDIAQDPDVVANANNHVHIMAFPTGKFEKVFLNHIGHVILEDCDLLKEYFRILKHGGMLEFKTEHSPEDSTQKIFSEKKALFGKALGTAGFKEITIEKKRDIENAQYKDFPWYLYVAARVYK